MVDRCSCFWFISLALFFSLFGTTLQQPILVSRQERFALLQLRSSLGLRSRDWPIKSDPCTVWTGIRCTNGRVTGINISRFKRTRVGSRNPRFAVDPLRNLTLLSSFNASNFELIGSIPDWLGPELGSLRVLDLSSCSIVGVIPVSIGNFSSLSELYLSNNNLTGTIPSSLGELTRLTVLDLSRNLLTGSIPVSFSLLGNLTSLDLSSNFVSGSIPPSIGNLSNLRFLNLSGNSLGSSIPGQLGNLSNLVDLDFQFNSLSGSLPLDFNGLRNVERLAISHNSLSGELTDSMFPGLTNLRYVDLSYNNFSGDFPNALLSIPLLQFIDASVNRFTGLLPNFSSSDNNNNNVSVGDVFNISQNLFYGNLPSVFRRFSIFDTSGNYFQGAVPFYASGNNASLKENCLQNLTNQRNESECGAFYTERGLEFDNFGLTNGTKIPSSKKSHRKVIILAAVLGGFGILVLAAVTIVLCIACKRRSRSRGASNQRSTNVGPVPASGSPAPPGGGSLDFSILGNSFTYDQILQLTGEFNETNFIKNGRSGDLFRGILEGGVPVVIKRIDLSVKRETHMLELDFFSKVSHPRFVPLLGHCLENDNEKFLVYKFMPNGDLSSSLFKKMKSEDEGLQSLDWITRLKIAIEAAEGLTYLHHECTPPLVHRDVSASSILLDDKYEVRLGSLSEVCAQEGDAHQNRITRLWRSQSASDQGTSGKPNATCAYDVYCFGKVLLELVTGKLGISSSSDSHMKEYLETTLPYISIYDKELVTNIVDPSLIIDEDLLEEVWAMAIVARSCLNPKPNRRPLMRYILKALENPLKVVREEHTSSARLRTTSSRGSWNAGALFGSWRHSSSDVAAMPASAAGTSRKVEGGGGSFKQSSDSQGSANGNGNGNSSSTRRGSKEIVPEPLDENRDVERD